MSRISKRLSSVKPSATLLTTAKVSEMRRNGIEVINLGVGEPDFDAPEFVKKAAIEAIDRGQTRYTEVQGTVEVRQAVQNKFIKDNNLQYDLNEIIVSAGCKQIIYNALMVVLNEGDEVIIPAPCWVSYPDMVRLIGGVDKIVECPPSNNFKLTAEQLSENITDKTKCIIINSPSNPTGMVYSYEELKALAEVLLLHTNIFIISDDIYEKIIYDNKKFYTIAEVEPRLKDRVITANGLSKSHAITGWRFGYAGGPRDVISAMTLIQSQMTSHPCSIVEYAAAAALSGPQDFLQEWLVEYKTRRDFVLDKLSKVPGLVCYKPEGAFYVFVDCTKLYNKKTPSGVIISSAEDVVLYFLEEARVAVVHSDPFGIEGYFRISYATSMQNLELACANIDKACGKLI